MIAVAPYSSDKLHLLHCPEGAIFIVKGISSLERRRLLFTFLRRFAIMHCIFSSPVLFLFCDSSFLFRRNRRKYSNFLKLRI